MWEMCSVRKRSEALQVGSIDQEGECISRAQSSLDATNIQRMR